LSRLTHEEETALFAQLRDGSTAARDRILEGNAHIAINESWRRRNHRWLLDELKQEALLALNTAIGTYQTSQDGRFGTYARRRIRTALRRYCHKFDRLAPQVSLDREMLLGSTLHDMLPSPANWDVLSWSVDATLRSLTERERLVVECAVMHDWQFQDIGDLLGVSRQRVEQIKVEALAKLRRKAEVAA
jgi:RNA polymerase sigma factor (sigma-70 family)